MFHTIFESELISQELGLVVVFLFPSNKVSVEYWVEDEQPLGVDALGVEEWRMEFPNLFKMSEHYGNTRALKELEVCHKWAGRFHFLIYLFQIQYWRRVWGMWENKMQRVWKRNLRSRVWYLSSRYLDVFSPVMFLRKTSSQGISKVVDIGLLNAYVKCTKENFPRTLATLHKVPLKLLSFEVSGKRYKDNCLPQRWTGNTIAFYFRMCQALERRRPLSMFTTFQMAATLRKSMMFRWGGFWRNWIAWACNYERCFFWALIWR